MDRTVHFPEIMKTLQEAIRDLEKKRDQVRASIEGKPGQGQTRRVLLVHYDRMGVELQTKRRLVAALQADINQRS